MAVKAYTIDAFKLDLTTGNSGTGLQCYIVNDDTFVVSSEDECLDYYPIYSINNGDFSVFNEAIYSIRPATRQEISNVGLWDYVMNKDVFLSTEDELDEYLRIGKELSEPKENDK